MVRRVFVWLHRWMAPLMAGLLVIAGPTGELRDLKVALTWRSPGG
jgi:hypothetical protein